MKIAVVGGGSTYTPELVSGLSRERERIDVRELVLHDIDAERREVVGGLAGADARAPGLRRAARRSPTTSTARSTAPTSSSSRSGSAARPRGSPTRRCRLRAAASARRPPARAASRRRCGRCRSCSRSPSACASSRSPDAWIVDFTNPVGIVTRSLLDAGHRAVGLCNVAIGFQRSFAQHLGVEPERRPRRPGRPQPPHLDPRRPRRRSRRAARAAGLARRRDRRAGRASRCGCSRSSASSPPPTSTTSTAHDAVLAEQLGGVPRAEVGGRDRARAARPLPRSGAGREAGAARAARRRLLQRGRDRARRLARQRATASSTRSTSGTTATLAGLADDDVVEVPARVESGRPRPASPGAARAGAARADPARRRLRAARRAGGRHGRPGTARGRRSSRIR